MQIRADRIELRETAEGYRQAIATGGAGQPAQYRQKRDASDETIEGRADRVEYDARADTLRFIGNALVRRSRGGNASEEIQGNLILWESIPIATCEAIQQGRLHAGDNTVFVGFGAGLTWGAAVVRWTGPFLPHRHIYPASYRLWVAIRSKLLRMVRRIEG